jgi:hypothetical protein
VNVKTEPKKKEKTQKVLTSLSFEHRDKKTHYLSGIAVESLAMCLILLGDFHC